MDMKLGLHGDMEINSLGLPFHIAGFEELVQRIYVLLSAKKGGFIYNRELGSGIDSVSPEDPQAVGRSDEYMFGPALLIAPVFSPMYFSTEFSSFCIKGRFSPEQFLSNQT